MQMHNHVTAKALDNFWILKSVKEGTIFGIYQRFQ